MVWSVAVRVSDTKSNVGKILIWRLGYDLPI